jgi:gas vesicle protein
MRKTGLTASLLASAYLVISCSGSGYQTRKSLLLNNETATDTEAFQFLKTVYEKGTHESALARQVAAQSVSSQVKEVAERVSGFYEEVLPEIESLAAQTDVLIPAPGMPAFEVNDTVAINEKEYLHNTLHEQKLVLDQFKRADRNTHKAINAYAKGKLEQIEELYEDTKQLVK